MNKQLIQLSGEITSPGYKPHKVFAVAVCDFIFDSMIMPPTLIVLN